MWVFFLLPPQAFTENLVISSSNESAQSIAQASPEKAEEQQKQGHGEEQGEKEDQKKKEFKYHTREAEVFAKEPSEDKIDGTKATLQITREDIKYNRAGYRHLTRLTLSKIHQITLFELARGKYQDLGIPGSPAVPLYYTLPKQMGRADGMDGYAPYQELYEETVYYHTRSPYSYFQIIPSIPPSYKQFLLKTVFGQNIKPTWNIGLTYHRHAATLPTQAALETENFIKDQYSTADYLRVFTHYYTKEKKYQLLADFFMSKNTEQCLGGVSYRLDEDGENKKRLDYSNDKVDFRIDGVLPRVFRKNLVTNYHEVHELSGASVQDMAVKRLQRRKKLQRVQQRKRLLVYQQYEFRPYLQVYLDTELLYKENRLGPQVTQAAYGEDPKRRRKFDIHSTTTGSLDNEVGLKGNVKSQFYNLLYARRDLLYVVDNKATLPYECEDPKSGAVSIKQRLISPKEGGSIYSYKEHYIGFRTCHPLFFKKQSLDLRGKWELTGYGVHDISLNYQDPIFNLSVQQMRYFPPLLMTHRYHHELTVIENPLAKANPLVAVLFPSLYVANWSGKEPFLPLTASQVTGSLTLTLPFLTVQPNLRYTRVKNYCFFRVLNRQDVTTAQRITFIVPHQLDAYVDFWLPGLNLYAHCWKLYLDICCNFLAKVKGPKKDHFIGGVANEKKTGKTIPFHTFPTELIQTKAYYEDRWFDKALNIAIGVETFYKSLHSGQWYDFVTGNYTLPPKDYFLYPHLMADLFVNMRVKSFDLFLKCGHVNYKWRGEWLNNQLSPTHVFFTTAATLGYPSTNRFYEISFAWHFYD